MRTTKKCVFFFLFKWKTNSKSMIELTDFVFCILYFSHFVIVIIVHDDVGSKPTKLYSKITFAKHLIFWHDNGGGGNLASKPTVWCGIQKTENLASNWYYNEHVISCCVMLVFFFFSRRLIVITFGADHANISFVIIYTPFASNKVNSV